MSKWGKCKQKKKAYRLTLPTGGVTDKQENEAKRNETKQKFRGAVSLGKITPMS